MKKRKILHALTYAVLTLGALLVFFPFYLTVVSSLKDMSDIFSNFFGLPRHIVFDNFAYVLQRPDYFIALKNSAIITGVAIVAMVFFFPCVLMPFPAEDLHPVFTAFSTFSW